MPFLFKLNFFGLEKPLDSWGYLFTVYKQQEFQIIEQLSKSRPLEVIVSDMTAFYVKGKHYELTLYTDVYTK